MSASSLSLPIFLRINFLISYLDSNRLTEHIRLTHTESFAEWQKAGAGCTSRAFKHPGHDVTAPDAWPSILTDYTYDSELDNADGVPLAFRRSSMFPEGNQWFLVVSSFGSPNKVLSLSQGNTASPRHGAGGSNNTTARIIVPPSFIAYTFRQCYTNLPTPWRKHVGACLNKPF